MEYENERRKYFENKNYIKEAKKDEWVKIQNSVEYVLDFYEKIGTFVKSKALSISSVYDLYSYYIQGYWELAEKSGFIERDRKEHEGGEDLYIETKNLYKMILKERNLRPFTKEGLKKFCEEER
ncbi:MAG: hypothetical protein HY266_10270 [Deltaproteobacteria bacterium]|nr:hypothetical protein [Deltaproteobacteria bacterium]